MTQAPYGFRIVGPCTGERRLIVWGDAFRAYAAVDPVAEPEQTAFLSAFTYGSDFAEYMRTKGGPAGFSGITSAVWLWFDIDRPELADATRDTRLLAQAIIDAIGLAEDDLLVFYSGNRGFHLGIPTATWQPEPSAVFPAVARRFSDHLAGVAGVVVDPVATVRVQPFRAPNSRHAKSGRYKRRLTVGELMSWAPAAILDKAGSPDPFEIPEPCYRLDRAAELWAKCADEARQAIEANAQRKADGNGTATLNRATLAFIRDGAAEGDRHRMMFSSSKNLGELGASFELTYGLLAESGLDSGLSPSEVERQIRCGLAAAGGVA